MPLILIDVPVEAKLIRAGDSQIILAAGDWLQIRHGNPENPTVILQEQVPQGKAWKAHVFVTIEETAA